MTIRLIPLMFFAVFGLLGGCSDDAANVPETPSDTGTSNAEDAMLSDVEQHDTTDMIADSGTSGDLDAARDATPDATTTSDAAADTQNPSTDTQPSDDVEQNDAEAADTENADIPEMQNPEWWGDPIEAEPDTWTWLDVPGAVCADGSMTGMGVNLHPGADRVFIYLEGGGACWDYNSCTGVATALHLDGFDEGTFNGIITSVYLNSLIFNRDDAKNPFRDAHMVFLPYCTADVFSGDIVKEFEGLFPWDEAMIHFKGYRNMEAYLARLVPTFQEVDRVVLSGSSAGGFGAGFTWPTVQAAFEDIPVDLLDDSGPPISPAGDRWAEWSLAWNIQLPPGCEGCEESVDAVRAYLVENMLADGQRRMGLMSFNKDTIISAFFGLLPRDFDTRLNALCNEYEALDNAQCFIVNGRLHTLLVTGVENVEAADDGTPLWLWIDQMVEGDEEWTSHYP